MDTNRFDTIAKLFAGRRSRRRALVEAGGGLAVAALATVGPGRTATATAQAQEATPAAGAGHKIAFLFLQAFRGGRVAPKEGAEGRYILTLEEGLGQTIYFSDRPDRVVGASPTPQFLDGLGFPAGNPPNAALVVETAAGNTEIAVIELFSPAYDEATHTATYEVAVLAEWERTGDGTMAETAADLTSLGTDFGAAHLFIDDCDDANIVCCNRNDLNCAGDCYCSNPVYQTGSSGFCYNFPACVPCEPHYHNEPYNGASWDHWTATCNSEFPDACNGNCQAGLFAT